MIEDFGKKIMKVFFLPKSLFHRFNRNIFDYFGSFKAKNFLHSSKIIRTFKEGDLERVLEIYEASFGNKNYNQIVKYSKLFKNTFYIYELDGVIVGYLGFYVHQKCIGFKVAQIATLYSIAIDYIFQGKGYGNQLLTESIKELQKNKILYIDLYVDIKNYDALCIYRTNGFKIIDQLKNICGKGKDCYKMRLILEYNYQNL